MNNKSSPKTHDASGDSLNATDIDKARPAVKLHLETEANDVESADETRSYDLNGSESNEHLHTSSATEGLLGISDSQNISTDSKAEEEEDVSKDSDAEEEKEHIHDVSTDSETNDEEENSQDVSTDSESDADEEAQNVSEKDEVEDLSELHLAAKRGDTEAVRSLLMSSANVDVLDTNQNVPLHIATINGHVDVVNLLLNKNSNVNSRNASGLISLHLASKKGHLAIAQLLLDSHADVNAVSRRQATPLHNAAKRGHAEIVRNLIFTGADVNACNKAKMTPLHLACRNGHTSIVKILLDNHATVDVTKQCEETPFYLAAKNGHADISDLLLSRGICDFVLINDDQTPLHVAVEKGHTKVVEVILEHSCRISDKLTEDGRILKENAKNLVETRDIKQMQLFKRDGRCVSAGVVLADKWKPLELWRNSDVNIALEVAILAANPKMVQLLLNADRCAYSEEHLFKSFHYCTDNVNNYKAEVCRSSKETTEVRRYDEQYEIHYENMIEIAHTLINSSKFNVNHQNDYGWTPLSIVMIPTDWSHTLPPKLIHTNNLKKLLLEKGADFNLKNSAGKTPLIIASEKGCCDAIQILFDWERKSGMKLELDARYNFGETALIKAAERHHVSVVRLLLNHKASVNLCNYYGFTALHAAIYQPNNNWFDFHIFCNGLRERKFDGDNSLEFYSRREEKLDLNTVIDRIQNYLERNKETTQFKEEVVKLLLDNDETNVNAIDLRGNTPLDLAVKSSKRITSATFEALKNRGAICNLLESEYEEPIEVARIDKRGRNPLHRLMISSISVEPVGDKIPEITEIEDYSERFNLQVYGILLRPENFMELAAATDNNGRTPLHYATMPSLNLDYQNLDLVRMMLNLGSNVNAADMYGKTPLHYAEGNDQYEILVQQGADENTKDNFGYTPKDLNMLRRSVTINEYNAKELTIGKRAYFPLIDIAEVPNPNHVTELSKRRLIETIRIYSQSPRSQESSEEAIWKIWTENEFIRLNRRLSQLKPSVQRFIERLADGIKEKDWRFECQPTLVGSADEETKVVISADFDFNFKLIKFSQLCDPFPHPLGPKGYFQLKRKPKENTKIQSDEKFDSFFNLDHCLLTKGVNFGFKIILKEVLSDPAFWQDEHIFDWILIDRNKSISLKSFELDGKCEAIELRMIHPIEDGEGGFLFVNISIDIVACIHVEGWWPEDPLPVGINPAVKTEGCTFIFDRPCCNPLNPHSEYPLYSETFARISFAPVESRIMKETSPLMKAAYGVCKMILYFQRGITYELKTCLLFCMEALSARNGSKTRNEDEITPKQLAFWVERIMFCFMEFYRHSFYPCYFMPSFMQRLVQLGGSDRYSESEEDEVNASSKAFNPPDYCRLYDVYLDLCPDDTTIDMPVEQQHIPGNRFETNGDPMWEQFDRKNFIRTLSSRISN